jgi:DNA-binding PadR family transcriptional regulator
VRRRLNRAERRVLAQLHRAALAMFATQIGDAASLGAARLYPALDHLAKAGLIHRDRRVSPSGAILPAYILTGEGHATLTATRPRWRRG